MGSVIRFVFVMVLAFGSVPAAALAQHLSFTGEGDDAFMRVPVRRGMDMPTLVRMANRFAARPGVTITEDDVVAMNPGKISYTCYRGRGIRNHPSSRDPARHYLRCPERLRRRWIVTPEPGRRALVYVLPLQPVPRREDVQISSAPIPAPTPPNQQAPHADPTADALTEVQPDLTPAQREAILVAVDAAIVRAEARFETQRRAFARGMVTQLELAEYRQEQAAFRSVLVCLVLAAVFTILWALWSAYRDRTARASTFTAAPAFAGNAASLTTHPGGQDLMQEAVQRAVIPVASALESALARVRNLEADRNRLAAQLEQERSRKESVPVVPPPPSAASRVGDWRPAGGQERNPTGTALTEKLAKLQQADVDLEAKRKHLWIVENDLPQDVERHREKAAKLALEIQSLEEGRASLVLAINTLTANMYGCVFPHLTHSNKERWAGINRQAVKALRQEFAAGLGRVSEIEVALSNAQSAEKVAIDEAARQTKLREEEVARLNALLAELRAESQRTAEALANSEESGQDQDRQIVDLSSQLVGLTGRVADLEAELAQVARARDLLQREKENLIAMLDEQANGHGQNPNGVNTRKITQPFAPIQRPAAQANPSGSPPSPPPKRRRRKTDPPPSG